MSSAFESVYGICCVPSHLWCNLRHGALRSPHSSLTSEKQKAYAGAGEIAQQTRGVWGDVRCEWAPMNVCLLPVV